MKNKAKVLVVGTFHFDYPGLDAHTIKESEKIDVLSEEKQKEMKELADYILQFKPNKIAIEASDEWGATQKLMNYQAGKIELGRDERYQLAIRIAAEMELDTLYAIDASNMYVDFTKTNEEFINRLTAGADSLEMDSVLLSQFKEWRNYSNGLAHELSLIEYFNYLNSREYHQVDYGNYLIDYFKMDNQRGADMLSMWWYNRNLRIFSKIQEITESENDRILVVFGNGHAAVLRQLLESSVEYEYVEFGDL